MTPSVEAVKAVMADNYNSTVAGVISSLQKAYDVDVAPLEARIAELEAALNTIETHLLGLVRIHSQFANEADGTWSGKKQKVRAGECSKILAFTRKTIKALEKIND